MEEAVAEGVPEVEVDDMAEEPHVVVDVQHKVVVEADSTALRMVTAPTIVQNVRRKVLLTNPKQLSRT